MKLKGQSGARRSWPVLVVVVFATMAVAFGCGGSSGTANDDGTAGSAGESAGGSGGDAGSGVGGTSGQGGSGGGMGGSAGAGASGGSAGAAGSGASAGAGGSGGPCVADDDCASGQLCDTLPEVCVECLFDTDCGTGEDCEKGTCVAVVSCRNSLDCSDAGVRTICDVAAGECVECAVDADCVDGGSCVDRRCESFEPCRNSLDCPTGQVCDADRCVDCALDADCGVDEACLADECVPSCMSDTQCTPLGLLCDPALGACVQCIVHADCPDVYHCNSGSCALDLCRAGTGSCAGNAVATCNANGTGFDTPSPCGSRQTCISVGDRARCEDWACTAGRTECDVDTVVECSADGLTILSSVDCTDQGLRCFSGECLDLLCEPDTRYCDGTEVKLCTSDGLSSSTVDTCTSLEFCEAATATCQPQLCTPGQPACDGNRATTCNADGSGYVTAGTDCTSSQTCVAGSCEDQICTPGVRRCSGNAVLECAFDGLSEFTFDACTASELCNPSTFTCDPLLCAPNQPACDGDVATTCNAQGSGYTGARTDCSLNGQTCANGACVASSTEVVGDTVDVFTGGSRARMNVYQVTTSRTLTEIEQYLSFTTSVTLTWRVYESTSPTGTFTQIHSSTTTPLGGGAGYYASGPISVPLVAGRYYVIGAAWTTSISYYRSSGLAPLSLSFATVTGSEAPNVFPGSTLTPAPFSEIYSQRITTAP